MNEATWVGAVIGGGGLAAGLMAAVYRGGRWVERISTAIELLTKIADDHEKRIRNGERARASAAERSRRRA